jgi:drug/metabolite transporter (DMT)-like permease
MVVDHFVTKADPIALSSIQFFTVSIISGVLMFVFERDSLSVYNVTQAIVPILYCGVLSSGIAYTLQVVSQGFTEPTIASLVMSLESLFAMVTACIFYQHLPSLREVIGCALMMVAIFIIETPFVDRAFNKLFKKKSAA